MDGEPTIEPGPWAQLEPVPLESLRHVLTTSIATAGHRIVTLDRRPLAAVVAEDRVLLLDARWAHLDRVYCLQNPFTIQGPQGDCAVGEVELDRASWRTGSPGAVAFDEDALRAYVVDEDRLYSADLDQMGEDPWAWLRLDEGVVLDEEPTGVIDAWVEEGELFVAGDALWRFSPSGALLERIDEAQVWEGPSAVDGDTVYTISEEGLLQGDTLHPMEPPLDLAVTPAHELLLLYADRVEVYVDESSLAQRSTPLRVFNTTFVEKPKSPIEDLPCAGQALAVETLVATATANRRLLDDLPGCHALGFTPHAVFRAQACQVYDQLPSLVGERTEVGVLFHEEPECTDEACYAAFLRDSAAQVDLDTVTWVAGLSANADAGYDWVGGLIDADLPGVVPFFGLSLHPDISHFDDPRSKEVWPLDYADWSRPRAASSAWDLEGGPVALFPGDSRSAFAQAGCANLRLRECQLLGLGDGNLLREGDFALLGLSLHRALAVDIPNGTWSWHLPDIGAWDYGEGCTVQDRRWSGCQAGLMQDWLFDIHARYVLNGLAEWTPPSRL